MDNLPEMKMQTVSAFSNLIKARKMGDEKKEERTAYETFQGLGTTQKMTAQISLYFSLLFWFLWNIQDHTLRMTANRLSQNKGNPESLASFENFK